MIINPRFSIAIPCYNNTRILNECFPSVMKLWTENSNEITEIIVIDDSSTDGTGDFFKQNYPSVTLFTNYRNLGFAKSCFKAIYESKNEWILLINSDVQIKSDIIGPLIQDIRKDPDLFAVSFYSFSKSGNCFEGRKFFTSKMGLYKTRNDFSHKYADGVLYDSFYATGGHCLLSREKFFKLGGFSPVFEPYYWEDVDLSYRALKRGWNVYFDPRCKVVHDHSSSIRASNCIRKIQIIQTRNKLIFFWKNISSPLLWIIHLSGLIFRLLTSWISGDYIFYVAFFKALVKIPQILKNYSSEKNHWLKNDKDLFRIGKEKRLSPFQQKQIKFAA